MSGVPRQPLAFLCAAVVGLVLADGADGGRLAWQREVAQSPEIYLDALDPALRRWYVPQVMFAEYPWRQWEYTNRARLPYQRYVNIDLEGDYFYDLYGNYLTQDHLDAAVVFQAAPERLTVVVYLEMVIF